MSSIEKGDTAGALSIASDAQRLEFLQKEYQEAAKAYALGVQAGQDFMRQYLYGNGILIALFGVAVGFSRDHGAASKEALIAIPIFAIVASAVLLSAVPHYRNLLNGCRQRCLEIEAIFGGKLYTHIAEISTRTRFGAVLGLSVMCAIFVLFWIAMLIVGIRV